LNGCRQFFVFISPRSVASKNVKNEINFALDLDKDFIAVHLEETELPAGLRLRMGDIQAIMRYRMPSSMFNSKIYRVLTTEARESPSAGPSVSGSEPETPVSRTTASPAMPTPEPSFKPTTLLPPSELQSLEADKPRPTGHAVSDLETVFKERLKSREYSNLPISEIKKAVVEDLGFFKDQVIKNVFQESPPDPEAEKRQQERAARRNAIIEQKRLQREIRLQLAREDKQEKSGSRRRRGCLPIPLSVIIIGVLIYLVVIHESYSSLSQTFIKTACPTAYTTEQKVALIGEYEKNLRKSQRSSALKDDIRRCKMADERYDRVRALGLLDMTIEELQGRYFESAPALDSPRHKLVEGMSNVDFPGIRASLPPPIDRFLESEVESRYRQLLIDSIIEAETNSSSPSGE
jgi:hypothetical protein